MTLPLHRGVPLLDFSSRLRAHHINERARIYLDAGPSLVYVMLTEAAQSL